MRDRSTRAASKPLSKLSITEELLDGRYQSNMVTPWNEHAVFAVDYLFGQPADIGGHDRSARTHGFLGNESKRLLPERRNYYDIGPAHQLQHSIVRRVLYELHTKVSRPMMPFGSNPGNDNLNAWFNFVTSPKKDVESFLRA